MEVAQRAGMTRTHRWLPPFLVAALGAGALVGCGPDRSAVLVGRLESSSLRRALTTDRADQEAAGDAAPAATDVPGDSVAAPAPRRGAIEISINGEPRSVSVDDDLTFAVEELPTGELSITVEVEGIKGTVTLEGVVEGEVIEIAVIGGRGRLEIRVIRRDVPEGGVGDLPVRRGPIEIYGKHIVYFLEPGVYDGDIIVHGHHVTLIGADGGSCFTNDRTVILGDLVVRGKHVRLVNMTVEGRTRISGHHVSVFGSCSPGAGYARHGWDDDDGFELD